MRSVELTDLASLVPLAGGWSGQTFLGEVAEEQVVVRIYPPGLRSDDAPEVDADLHRLVRGLLPVPDVLEVRRGDAGTDVPGLLVTAWCPGVRGDLVLPRLDAAGLRRAGASLGTVAAVLAGMPVLRGGAFEEGLSVVEMGGPPDLPSWVEERLGGQAPWSPLLAGLLEVAEQAEEDLATVTRRSVVHSDLNPKNVLLDEETLEVTAVLDWEFAHAGLPVADLGNLLRFDRHPAYVEGVLEAWCARHGVEHGGPERAVELARSADLWALVDLASRAGANPVADRADRLLRRIAETREVSAWSPQER